MPGDCDVWLAEQAKPRWPWHWPMVLAFVLNLGLAAASYVILQSAAKLARDIGVRNHKAKVNRKETEAAKSGAEHEASRRRSFWMK